MKNRLTGEQTEWLNKLRLKLNLMPNTTLDMFALEVPKAVQDELFWYVALKMRGGVKHVHEIPEKFQNEKLHRYMSTHAKIKKSENVEQAILKSGKAYNFVSFGQEKTMTKNCYFAVNGDKGILQNIVSDPEYFLYISAYNFKGNGLKADYLATLKGKIRYEKELAFKRGNLKNMMKEYNLIKRPFRKTFYEKVDQKLVDVDNEIASQEHFYEKAMDSLAKIRNYCTSFCEHETDEIVAYYNHNENIPSLRRLISPGYFSDGFTPEEYLNEIFSQAQASNIYRLKSIERDEFLKQLLYMYFQIEESLKYDLKMHRFNRTRVNNFEKGVSKLLKKANLIRKYVDTYFQNSIEVDDKLSKIQEW